MNWDINAFLTKFRGGFDSGQAKRDEEARLRAEEDKVAKQDEAEARKSMDMAEKARKADELHQYKIKKEQLGLLEKLVKLFGGAQKTDAKQSETTPTATPTPNPMIEALQKGFADYGLKSGMENPLATASAYMAQKAQENPLPDPYLPAVMNLMETGGSKHMAQPNNYFNWGTNPKPDINTAIDRIYEGVSNPEGKYADYIKSGNLADFFRVYTPSSDPRNPTQDELIKRYTQLRKYFE